MNQFVTYCQLIQLVDAQFTIENSFKNQLTIIFVVKKLEEFFWKYIVWLSNTNVKKLEQNFLKELQYEVLNNIFVVINIYIKA